MPIAPLPPLDRSSTNFKADVDTFFANNLPVFSNELNTLAAAIDADATATAADRVQTGLDRTAAALSKTGTAADATAAALSKTGTTADAVATAADRTAAANSATTAGTQAGTAATQASLASQWAAQLINPVTGGEYSAKYWAQQAAATVIGQLIYRGSWSAATGSYPASPIKGDFYKVSVDGTVSSISYNANDSIIYNGSAWDKIDSTDQVSSVAGRVGAVVLGSADVGLGNVNNTSDSSKPVSTPQQNALNLKADLGTAQAFTKAQRGAVLALTDAATITIDLALSNNFSVTLAGSRVLANPTNVVAGQSGVITITQDATGSRTLAFGSIYDFTSGAVIILTSTAGARDHLAYYVDLNLNVVVKALGDAR